MKSSSSRHIVDDMCFYDLTPCSYYALAASVDSDVTCNGGADCSATASASGVGIEIPSQYGMETFDHITYDDGTEVTDAYTGAYTCAYTCS